MRIYDSTKTRVIPLMKEINGSIDKLNDLFSLLNTQRIKMIDPNEEIQPPFFGEYEKKLCPKEELLEWYVYNYNKLKKVKCYGSKNKKTQEKRKLLFEGSKEKIEEAIRLIRNNPMATNGWYIFEGYSHPDIYIETSNSIYIGEAKRTESKLTTSTQWLSPRDQLIRHVDSVIDSVKKVYCFLLIDEKKEFKYKLKRYETDYNYYEKSLPHRAGRRDEIEKIMSSYCGYTTWQKIEEKFCITFPDTIITN